MYKMLKMKEHLGKIPNTRGRRPRVRCELLQKKFW